MYLGKTLSNWKKIFGPHRVVEASVYYFLHVFASGWEAPNSTVYMSLQETGVTYLLSRIHPFGDAQLWL